MFWLLVTFVHSAASGIAEFVDLVPRRRAPARQRARSTSKNGKRGS